MSTSSFTRHSRLKTILIAGLVAGTLDISAAIIILAKMKAAGTFRFIASGVFGDAAFSGGWDMVVWGLILHYFIAMSFAAAYALLYPRIVFLQKFRFVAGILYGILVWCVMNLLVVPSSQAPHGPLEFASVLKNMTILIVCIGLPIALITNYFAGDREVQPQ